MYNYTVHYTWNAIWKGRDCVYVGTCYICCTLPWWRYSGHNISTIIDIFSFSYTFQILSHSGKHSQPTTDVQAFSDPQPHSIAAGSSSSISNTESSPAPPSKEGTSVPVSTIQHVAAPSSTSSASKGVSPCSTVDTTSDSFSFHSAGSYSLKPELVAAVRVTCVEHSGLGSTTRLPTLHEEEEEVDE